MYRWLLARDVLSGDPMRPLLWVSKSKLAVALQRKGHKISASSVRVSAGAIIPQ